MKKLLTVLAVLAFASAASAGTLTITYSAAGNASYSLTAGQNALINLWVTKLNGDKCTSVGLPTSCTQADITALNPQPTNPPTLYTSVGNWLLLGPMVETLQSVRANVESNRVTAIFAPTQASSPASTAQCTAVGLTAGCLNSAVRDAICGGLGLQAGCSPR